MNQLDFEEEPETITLKEGKQISFKLKQQENESKKRAAKKKKALLREHSGPKKVSSKKEKEIVEELFVSNVTTDQRRKSNPANLRVVFLSGDNISLERKLLLEQKKLSLSIKQRQYRKRLPRVSANLFKSQKRRGPAIVFHKNT
jgi:hypothetical protein